MGATEGDTRSWDGSLYECIWCRAIRSESCGKLPCAAYPWRPQLKEQGSVKGEWEKPGGSFTKMRLFKIPWTETLETPTDGPQDSFSEPGRSAQMPKPLNLTLESSQVHQQHQRKASYPGSPERRCGDAGSHAVGDEGFLGLGVYLGFREFEGSVSPVD